MGVGAYSSLEGTLLLVGNLVFAGAEPHSLIGAVRGDTPLLQLRIRCRYHRSLSRADNRHRSNYGLPTLIGDGVANDCAHRLTSLPVRISLPTDCPRTDRGRGGAVRKEATTATRTARGSRYYVLVACSVPRVVPSTSDHSLAAKYPWHTQLREVYASPPCPSILASSECSSLPHLYGSNRVRCSCSALRRYGAAPSLWPSTRHNPAPPRPGADLPFLPSRGKLECAVSQEERRSLQPSISVLFWPASA